MGEFLDREVEPRGLVSPEDRSLFLVTDDVDEAATELLGFYRNYHSCRWVGDLLVLRLQRPPDRTALAALNGRFADILAHGRMRLTKPLPPNGPTTITSTSPGWPSASTRSTTAGCAS